MPRSEWTPRLGFATLAILTLILGASLTAYAGENGSDAAKPDDDAKADAAKPDDAAKADKEKPDFPPFDEVSEDHEKIAGFFDLYIDKKKDHVLAVIPKSMLGKNFLISSSIAGGPQFTGFMWGTQLVQWQEMDKKLVLLAPDLRNQRAKNASVEDVVARTYTDRIVLSTRILSKRGADPVIDFDDVFKSDRAGLGPIYGGSVNAGLSKWVKTKGFDKNVELAVDNAIMNRDGEGTYARVHYSISELPENDYKPRQADDRVGYFMTAVKDWAKDHNDKTIFDRYVHRWRLRKADPKADVSDVHPDDQIVFYIEKTVPIKYRRYVREGILEWNKAFAKAGLLNAVAVRQQTDTNEFKDIDPEDVRYNFFRWIVSGRAFAMGPSRVNPMTGQILDADIVFDDALVRSQLRSFNRFGAKGPAALYDPQLHEFLDRNPEWGFEPVESRLAPEFAANHCEHSPWDSKALAAMMKMNPSICTLANGLQHELSMATLVHQADGGAGLSDAFIGNFIRYVVAHEVGHTLGLRHNFKASTWKSMDELLDAKGTDEPTSGSVMDYNAAIFAESAETQPNFFTPALGPYDLWAIEYGYRHTDDELKTEEELLAAVAARGNEPGHAYGSDEDTGMFAPDPSVNRWDNGSDALAYAKQRMDMVDRLRADITNWSVEDGESYSHLRQAFDGLLGEYGRAAQFAARYIGGQYVSRNHKGDAGEQPPIQIVSTEKQREALDFLIQHVFSDTAFQFDPELLNKLGPGRWGHWDTDNYDPMREYPLHDRIASTQFWAMFHVTNPFTLTRVYDAELKVPADQDALTVAELITKTTAAIWSELAKPAAGQKFTNRKPMISSVRRSLQRSHLNTLVNMLLEEPGRMAPADAHAIARMSLKGLSQQIGGVIDGGGDNLDAFTRAHLDEARTRIDKALEAEFRM
jgi:hypothetical protein